MTDADDLIAQALRTATPWPDGMETGLVQQRAIYHGITGLLMVRAVHLADWPEDLRTRLRAEALAQTMWEVRHRSILTPLLAALEAADVKTVLLKGTALAYSLYPAPAQRNRGDTDLLVAPDHLDRARAILTEQGFATDMQMAKVADPERQESWTFTAADGGEHEIDLHVDVFSSPALMPVLQGAVSGCAGPALAPGVAPCLRAPCPACGQPLFRGRAGPLWRRPSDLADGH
jgi:hypothetical protein